MPILIHERKHLALSDRHIKEMEERIRKHLARKAELEAAELDTEQTDKFLELLNDALDLMYQRRRQILAALSDEESKIKSGKSSSL
jgi:Tfp pilus assembly protein PilN